ncbi:hypothetical protein [Streptomyces beigongshangae]|uniref:hypothetical protein n=1 Tax=Streptomyces beigongshangae TaxID=2841597 RepID=UPI0021A62F2D|nr:hypothetical protein [Streptomyces sp. REN17]
MDTALAVVDVAAVVFTVRGVFSRRHVLAEARRHLLETLRGRAYVPGIDSHIADRALERYGRQLTVPQKGRRTEYVSFYAPGPLTKRLFLNTSNSDLPTQLKRRLGKAIVSYERAGR